MDNTIDNVNVTPKHVDNQFHQSHNMFLLILVDI